MMEQDNCCVMCGEIIPEGMMCCYTCMRKTDKLPDENFHKKDTHFINRVYLYIKKSKIGSLLRL